MIAMRPMLSTFRPRHVACAVAAAERRCSPSLLCCWAAAREHLVPPGPAVAPPRETADAFVMPDGTRLPYRAWLPDGEPWAVVLALHGMNDSRDAWEYPAPELAAHGVAVFAPDQRGFGDTDGARLLAGDAGAGGRCARHGAAAAPAISACAADPDGREHGRRGADVPRDRAGSAAGGRLRAGGARGVGAGGDERVPAHQLVAVRQSGARA